MTPSTTTPHTKGHKKVLIAEDDQFLARALTSKFKKEGFDVRTVRNGDEALSALAEFTPDMLLLDLVMPGKNGFAVLEALRADTQWQQLPVIVLSNLSQAPDIAATKELGVLEHIVKSDTPLAKIVQRVTKHLV